MVSLNINFFFHEKHKSNFIQKPKTETISFETGFENVIVAVAHHSNQWSISDIKSSVGYSFQRTR